MREIASSPPHPPQRDDLIRQVIGRVADTPRDPPSWLESVPKRERGKPDPEVPMTGWADWHLGEVVEAQEVYNYNAYNMANRRGARPQAFDKTIYLTSEHHTGNYPGIVVNLGRRHGLRRSASRTAQDRRA
jgi:hypothetical protein